MLTSQVKQVNKMSEQIVNLERTPGPAGLPGPAGPSGHEAAGQGGQDALGRHRQAHGQRHDGGRGDGRVGVWYSVVGCWEVLGYEAFRWL